MAHIFRVPFYCCKKCKIVVFVMEDKSVQWVINLERANELEKEAKLTVLQEELGRCRSEVAAYNLQFLSSSAMRVILTAAASVISIAAEEIVGWTIFYILPTICFLGVYNVIKYTGQQLKLNAYLMVLEHKINEYFQEDILCWSTKMPRGFNYVFFGAVVQIFFDIPVLLFMIWGFFKIQKGILWYAVLIFDILQIVILFVMALCLTKEESEALEKLGYKFNGSFIERINSENAST